MEFTYKSVTGNITIDVGEEWVAILRECDREEYNNDHTETRRHYHFEALEYEGSDYGAEDAELLRLLETDEARRTVEPALQKLTSLQRDVVDALFYKGMSVKEFAASREIAEPTVSKAKKAALKNLRKMIGHG